MAPEEQRSLADLLSLAEGGTAYERFQQWEAPLVAQGAAAIPAMREWLCDASRDGWFASVVLREIGRTGDREAAIEALRDGARCANDRVRGHIANALATFGIVLDEPVGIRGRLAPSYMKPKSVLHVLVDLAPATGTSWGDVYLTACGWAYSGDGLQKLGGPVEPDGRSICSACQYAQEKLA